MFYGAITPLLPHLSEKLDLSKSEAGVLAASYAAGTLLGSLPGGWLAGRIGVKPTLLAGLALLGATSLVFGFAQSVLLLDLMRFVQGIGGAFMWSAGLAWLVGASPPERRGELIGSALGAAIAGGLLGPVLGGAASELGPEPVFAAVSVASLLLGIVAWGTPGIPPAASGGMRSLFSALRARPVLVGVGLFVLPAVYSGVLGVLAPLRLDELGASGLVIGAVFLAAGGVEALLSPVVGRLSDRHGRLLPIRAGLAGAAICAFLLPLPGSAVLLAAVVLLGVSALGAFWAPVMALLSDASDDAGLDQGLGFAISNLAWSSGQLIGGGGGAALADASADAVPYWLLAAACALTLARLLAPGRAMAGSAGGAGSGEVVGERSS